MTKETIHIHTPDLLNQIFKLTQSVTNAPVQENFRLVQGGSSHPEMYEFISSKLGGRFVAMASTGRVAKQHAELEGVGVPVLTSIQKTGQLLLLGVPEGARPIASYVHGMRTDPESYAHVFEGIGRIMGQLERLGMGLPEPTEDYPLLKQFAVIPDEHDATGGSVSMLPPYSLSRQSRQDIEAQFKSELEATNTLLTDQTAYLVEKLEDAWG